MKEEPLLLNYKDNIKSKKRKTLETNMAQDGILLSARAHHFKTGRLTLKNEQPLNVLALVLRQEPEKHHRSSDGQLCD